MAISTSKVTHCRLLALTSLAIIMLSLVPQLHLWFARGTDWNGAYVSSQTDEPLYSAYVNALIDGRGRKNDPFGGRDNLAGAPLPESIFSIQFVPAYAIALPARTLGLSASSAFIFLTAASALLSSLAVFWLLRDVTRDLQLAAAGTIFVLCIGGISAKFGMFGTLIDMPFPVLPFLRRYQPAAAFPLFFVFQTLVWRALTGSGDRLPRKAPIAAALTLIVLVFSYLYLWTAAAAWLVCISGLWLVFRSSDRRRTIKILLIISALVAFALVGYLYLLAHRPVTLDEQQVLISTHLPDLLRVHEILGAAMMAALFIGIWRGRIKRTDPRAIYAGSLAFLPLVVFNQQVLTGKTLQAFHFENYVVNYSTMLGLLVTAAVLWRPVSQRFLIWMAGLSLAWGVIAVGLPARLDSVPAAIARDKSVPVFMRLRDLTTADGTIEYLRTKQQPSTLVFSPDVSLTKWLPTWTSQGTLLDQTGVDCGTLTFDQRKQYFFMHLYYSKVETEALRQALNGTLFPARKELTSAASVIFGYGRVFPELSSHFKPIEGKEIEFEVSGYSAYVSSFTRAEALKRPIAYAIVASSDNFDFSNIDHWYERDIGERVGDYTLYRLKLRD
jgi:hypothetical protein